MKSFKALNPDQKCVLYAYVCTLGIAIISVLITQNFGCGATLLLFLSPFIRALFAIPNTSENTEPGIYQFEDGRILPVEAYDGYFKRLFIFTPLLAVGLLALIALCFDHPLFGSMAFLLILGYNTILISHLLLKKLPLLSWEFNQDHNPVDDLPMPNIKFMKEDLFNRTLYDPKYSNIPGNMFNDAYRPKNHDF